MKEKLKAIIYGGAILYSIAIIILMLINAITLVTTIELSDSKENKEKLNQYKRELLVLEQNACTEVINQLIEKYEETSYEGEVKLTDIYWYYIDETSYLSYYSAVKNNCNLSDEQLQDDNYPIKFVGVSIYLDRLIQQYNFQFELSFKDLFLREHMESNFMNIDYKLTKAIELDVISSLIEIEKKEMDDNA